MGGKAFEGTARLTPSEHARVKQRVMTALQHEWELAHTLHVVSSAEVLEKSSFGDVDLYASSSSCSSDSKSSERVRDAMTQFVAATLRGPAAPVRNGRTVSFLTPERYQVDIGFAPDAALLGMYATVHSNGDFARLLQVSLSPLRLRLTTQGLFLRRARDANVSRRDASFLLSVNPTKVGEFLGLPHVAFDGQTSLSTARAFDLVVDNRFFDGAAMTAWLSINDARCCRNSRRRPMLVQFSNWWHSTGISSFGDRKPDCNSTNEEAWVDFFNERERFHEWTCKGKLGKGNQEMEMEKECKQLLNFGLIQSWFPEFSNVVIGAVLRKIRGEHGQCGSVELLSWLRGMSPESLRHEVGAAAQELEQLSLRRRDLCGMEFHVVKFMEGYGI